MPTALTKIELNNRPYMLERGRKLCDRFCKKNKIPLPQYEWLSTEDRRSRAVRTCGYYRYQTGARDSTRDSRGLPL